MEQPDLSAIDHAAKDDLIRFLLVEIAELKSNKTALEVRLAKNSHNSNKPPSSDGPHKPTPKSLRQAGQRPKGGQKGHKGSVLERVAEPDHVIIHPLPATSDACGSTLDEAHISKACQVFDIPPQQVLKSPPNIAFWKQATPAARYIRATLPKGYSHHAIWSTGTNHRRLSHPAPYAADSAHHPNHARYLWCCPIAGCCGQDNSHRRRQPDLHQQNRRTGSANDQG